ncbi:FadR/GntR family transcriptional regulator [Desulfoluna butyratoxydans]|uniref:Transcription regulator hth gntr n=1 Tax=Desulfoluna butyratoxydans TaxID=231438 RepID=A0A4U8YMM9_9BACT|nr:GntR family transcriptional regulator [Desulfoluna butyratoxydans]VFQ45315.1 transcription regulator hth gntr [Desulfoluna butyratoxydans]
MPTCIADTVFESLRKDIFNGRYEPGSRLPSERELADRFDASRNTVRDALSRLDHMKLVKRVPQSGTYVTDYRNEAALSLLIYYIENSLDLNDEVLTSFMDFRLISERFAVKRAVHNLGPGDLCHLHGILDEKQAAREDARTLAECDYAFHEFLFQKAESLAVQLIFNTLKPVFINYLTYYYNLGDDPDGIIEYQRSLVSALETKDEELCGYMMEKLLLFGINLIKEARLTDKSGR